MTSYTENKTDSSSSDSSGEKMLTDDDLTALREHWPLSAGHVDINELLDHIAALSATIKRLETPVADAEVEEAAVYVESWSTIQRSACLNDVADKSLSIASLLRRQARENASLAEGWHDAEVKLVGVEAEIASLQHDLSRHLSITSEQATEILGKEKEIERLKTALAPFAEAAHNWADADGDREKEKQHYIDSDATLTVFDLREARAALLQLKGK